MAADAPETVALEPFDFGDAGQLTNEQLRTLRAMDEMLARNLTHALSAWLRTSVTVTAGPQCQVTFHEFAEKLDGSYLLALQLPEHHASALLSWPLPLAAHLIELLLGGSGGLRSEARELTEIEDAVFSAVLEVMLRETNVVWSQIGLRVTAGEQMRSGAERQMLPAGEKVFCFVLPVEVGEVGGEITLCLAASVLASVLRRAQASRPMQHSGGERNLAAMLTTLRQARVRAGMCFPPIRVPASTLARLRVGGTLVLPLPSNAVGEFRISDTPLAAAAPVRVGERRAAQIGPMRSQNGLPTRMLTSGISQTERMA